MNKFRTKDSTQADGFSFGRDDDNLLVDLDAVFVAQNAGQQNLGTVADRVHLTN
jgi:hypothetical protein